MEGTIQQLLLGNHSIDHSYTNGRTVERCFLAVHIQRLQLDTSTGHKITSFVKRPLSWMMYWDSVQSRNEDSESQLAENCCDWGTPPFRNPEEGAQLLLKAITTGLMMTQLTERMYAHAVENCRLYGFMNYYCHKLRPTNQIINKTPSIVTQTQCASIQTVCI
jgi:hypothetical protein